MSSCHHFLFWPVKGTRSDRPTSGRWQLDPVRGKNSGTRGQHGFRWGGRGRGGKIKCSAAYFNFSILDLYSPFILCTHKAKTTCWVNGTVKYNMTATTCNRLTCWILKSPQSLANSKDSEQFLSQNVVKFRTKSPNSKYHQLFSRLLALQSARLSLRKPCLPTVKGRCVFKSPVCICFEGSPVLKKASITGH